MTAEEVGGLSCVCFVVKVGPTLKQQHLRRPVIIRLRILYSGKQLVTINHQLAIRELLPASMSDLKPVDFSFDERYLILETNGEGCQVAPDDDSKLLERSDSPSRLLATMGSSHENTRLHLSVSQGRSVSSRKGACE